MLFTSTVCCLCTHSSTLQPAVILQWEQRLLLEFQHAFTWADQVELTYCTFVRLHLSKQEPGKNLCGIWGEDKCVATKQACVFSSSKPHVSIYKQCTFFWLHKETNSRLSKIISFLSFSAEWSMQLLAWLWLTAFFLDKKRNYLFILLHRLTFKTFFSLWLYCRFLKAIHCVLARLSKCNISAWEWFFFS